ncbi:MAG TPA: cyclodeaminase/cyclohydrolase family protein [Candidatus Limnocylindrales bacterium]|jgi:formiminotetrahydrofolate cyclodeaminase
MENSRFAVSFADLTVGQFLDRLSSAEAVPGGGSASALAGALGASLISMVCALSTGRPKYEAYESTLARCGEVGRDLAAELMDLADQDAFAYAGYAAALKLPRDTDEERASRRAVIRDAARAASEAPMACVIACTRLAGAAESLAGRSNVHAASDVLVAALLAEAAARGAAENVRINLPATDDEQYADVFNRKLDAALHEIAAVTSQTREAVLSGQPREPEDE